MPIQRKSEDHPLTRLWHYARGHHKQTMLASTYSVLNKLFDLAPPILIGMAVDVVVSQEDSILASLGITDVTVQLWVLDKGVLREHGRHEELVAVGGIYAGLWRVQTG